METRNRTFVVTGGGNGIGREVVLILLQRGARVAAVDLSETGLAETVSLAPDAGVRLSTHAVDVADADRVAALPDEVLAAHGTIDGLLNVAGIIQPFVRFADLDRATIEKVMDVNFWGVVNTCRAFLPHLVARPAASVVNVSSMGGFVPVPGQTIYGASKAAVKLLTEGLRAEMQGTNVAVTIVFPGAIATHITENSGVTVPGAAPAPEAEATAPKHRTMPAPEAAEQIVRALEKGTYRVTVGKDATFLDRLVRLAPERAMQLIAKQMADLLAR